VSEVVECMNEVGGLVNRLAQELAQVQRTMATSQRKLTSVTRSLEARTQELAEARAALSLLLATLDASKDAVLAMGYYGRAMHFNSRFIELWGIAPAQIEGFNDEALLALQLTQVRNPARFLEFVQARRARPDQEYREMVELTDGRMFECHVMPQRLRGRRVGSVTSFRDMTEILKLERVVTLLEAELPERVAEAKATVY